MRTCENADRFVFPSMASYGDAGYLKKKMNLTPFSDAAPPSLQTNARATASCAADHCATSERAAANWPKARARLCAPRVS